MLGPLVPQTQSEVDQQCSRVDLYTQAQWTYEIRGMNLIGSIPGQPGANARDKPKMAIPSHPPSSDPTI